MKVLHSICQQIWKTQQWPQDWKRSVFILIPKRGNAKKCSNYYTIALISHASKVMLRILQVRLQQYVNRELPYVQAGFRKGKGIRDQIANTGWIIERTREFQKNTYFFLTHIQLSLKTDTVVWYSHLFKNFPLFLVIHTVKGFDAVNEAEVDIFLEFPCCFHDPTNVGNLISAFSKPRLYIWKLSVHELLKPSLKDFEHNFDGM